MTDLEKNNLREAQKIIFDYRMRRINIVASKWVGISILVTGICTIFFFSCLFYILME